MSSRTLREPGHEVVDTVGMRPSLGPWPIGAAISSALLLWAAFPPINGGWLAWLALAPLFLLIRSRRSPASIYAGAWAGGLVFWLLSIHWISLTDETAWLAWVVMALALSFWWPGFLALARLAVLRFRLPMIVAAPILWVGLEFVRAHILTGFPWYYLAHSQHAALPLIQIADLAGALGISFLVAMVNAWWVDLLTLPLLHLTTRGPRPTRPQVVRGAVVALLLAGTVGYGVFRLAGESRFRNGPRLALIQSNIEQRYKMGSDPRDILAIYKHLVDQAIGGTERPDLIVWPETAYPYGFVALDPRLDPLAFEHQVKQVAADSTVKDWRLKMRSVTTHLHGWSDAIKVPMLVGTLTYDFHPDGLSKFNSALLFEPNVATVQGYHKIHLVPFGEYVPLIETFPWLTALTPYRGSHVPSLTFGRKPTWFRLGHYRFATAICFEDTVPHAVRRFFSEAKPGQQPDLLINISNDGWFHGSPEHDMHLAVSIFRAIENRVPLARAVNTGLSAIIDGNGRVRASLPKLHEGVLTGVLPLDDRVSLYSASGDWLGLSCLAFCIGLVPLALTLSVIGRHRQRPAVSPL